MKKTTLLFVTFLLFKSIFLKAENPPKNSVNQSFFIENQGQLSNELGQSRQDIKFYHRQNQLHYYIKENGFSYQVVRKKETAPDILKTQTFGKINEPIKQEIPAEIAFDIFRIDVELIGAQKPSNIEKLQSVDYYENHYIGNPLTNTLDRYENCRAFEKIIIKDIYPSIDWVVYFKDNNIKYDFVVHPGGNPALIQMKYLGANSIEIDPMGQLQIEFDKSQDKITENAPISFSGNQEIKTRFKIKQDHILTFELENDNYNKNIDLVIDPCLKWGSFYGGTSSDYAYGTAIDASNNLYQTGTTYSPSGIATSGAFKATLSTSGDIYMIKINSSGEPIHGTYFGGTNIDIAYGISVYGNRINIAGHTQSTGLATSGAHQTNLSVSSMDGIIIQFKDDGNLIWSSYYGGSGTDGFKGICNDLNGNIYAYGSTNSNSGIATSGAYRTTNIGTNSFFVKFSINGVRNYGSYFSGSTQSGGSSDDYLIQKMGIDKNGLIYLVGYTSYSYIPTINPGSAYTQAKNTGWDGFIARFSTTFGLQWFTYYGGNGSDFIYDCTIDLSVNLIITGYTSSTNLVATSGTNKGSGDGITVKFNSTGVRLWGYYFGGINEDFFEKVTVDKTGIIYVGGYSSSTGVFTSDAFQTTSIEGKTRIFMKLNASGSIIWSTAYGGNTYNTLTNLLIHSDGDLFVAGYVYAYYGTELVNNYGNKNPTSNYKGYIGKIGTGNIILNTTETLCGGKTSINLCRKTNFSGLVSWENNLTSTCRTINKSGNYWVKTTNTTVGCTWIDSFNVIQAKNTSSITQLTPYCTSGQNTELTVKAKSKYTSLAWYNPSNSLISYSNKISTSVTGIYTTIMTLENGCKDTGKYYLSPTPLDVRISKYSRSQPCGNSFVPDIQQGTPVELTYSWSPNTNISNPNIKNPVFIVSASTKRYILTTSYKGTCTEQDTLDIQVANPLEQSISINPNAPSEICAGRTLKLSGSMNPKVENSYKDNYPISMIPFLPNREDSIQIIFDASKGDQQLKGSPSVYITFGAVVNCHINTNYWYNVQGQWGKADPKFKMKKIGLDSWSYSFKIDRVFELDNSQKYYQMIPAISHIAMVFSDSTFKVVSKTANNHSDLYYPIYDTLNLHPSNSAVQLIQPAVFNYEPLPKFDVFENDSIPFRFISNGNFKNWEIKLGNKPITQITDANSISFFVKGNFGLTTDTLKIICKNSLGQSIEKRYLIASKFSAQKPRQILWQWGDNTSSVTNVEEYTSKKYSNTTAGNKQIKAKVNFLGCTYTQEVIHNISLINSVNPNFTYSPSILCDNGTNLINFDASSSSSKLTGTFTNNHKWIFPDNSTSSGVQTSKSLPNAGDKIIKLISYSDPKCQDTTIKTLVINQRPTLTVSASPSDFYCEGNSMIFGTPINLINYKWYKQNESGGWDWMTSDRIYNPKEPGTYRLTASNIKGCSDTQMLIIKNNPVTIEAPLGTNWCDYSDVLKLRVKENFTSYRWLNGATNKEISVNEPGTYSVRGINGTCTTAYQSITILNENNSFNSKFTVTQNSAYRYTFTPIIKPKYAAWTFGDGEIDIYPNPTHTYQSKGIYTVCLDGKSKCGNRDIKCTKISVNGLFSGVEDTLQTSHVFISKDMDTYTIKAEGFSNMAVYEIYSISGALIISQTPIDKNKFQLNHSGGIYILKIIDDSKSHSLKFEHTHN